MANTGRTHFKKGQKPAPHKEGCQCFRCTHISSNTGKILTTLQRERISYLNKQGVIGMKGKTHTEKTKEKMRAKAMGRKHTEETRKKISMSQIGIKKEPLNGYSYPLDYRERRRFRHEMQKLIFERDNYTCQLCGVRGKDLQVDHIQSWAEYIELRFSMDNCRTLCAKCHYKITFGKPMPKSVKAWGHNLLKGGN